MRFGEWYADGKTTTEILHVVQNDGLGVGRNSVGLGRRLRGRAGIARMKTIRRSGLDETEFRLSADYLPAWGWGELGAVWHQICGCPQARAAVKSMWMGSSDWLSSGNSLGTERGAA